MSKSVSLFEKSSFQIVTANAGSPRAREGSWVGLSVSVVVIWWVPAETEARILKLLYSSARRPLHARSVFRCAYSTLEGLIEHLIDGRPFDLANYIMSSVVCATSLAAVTTACLTAPIHDYMSA